MHRDSSKTAENIPVWHRGLGLVVGLVMGAGGGAVGATARQHRFPAPDAGMQALIEAVTHDDTHALVQILGSDAASVISTGDSVSDRASRRCVVQAYNEAHALVQSTETQMQQQRGTDACPFPLPLVTDHTQWRFDSIAGKAEIRNRRLGRNEPDVIQVCLAFVDAQRAYDRRTPSKRPCSSMPPGACVHLVNETACIGRPRPTSHRVPWELCSPRREGRATPRPPAHLPPLTAPMTPY